MQITGCGGSRESHPAQGGSGYGGSAGVGLHFARAVSYTYITATQWGVAVFTGESQMAKAKSTGNAARIARDAISAAISSLQGQVASTKERIVAIRKARHVILQPALTRIAMILESVPEQNKRLRTTAFTYSPPEISVTLLRQPSLKGDVICELLAYASDVCPKVSSSDYVTASYGERTHRFCSDDLEIVVHIDVADKGTCRKVLTGTKTVHQEQYEFVCDD